MSDKPNNWYPSPESPDKLSTEIYDAKAGTYKDAQLEGKQVAPKHDSSPFTGNTPKEK